MTTLQLGGDARYFAAPAEREELELCLERARQKQIPWWFLGGGSNVVIADSGLPGLVLQCQAAQQEIVSQTSDEVILEVEAGVNWDAFVQWTVLQGWAGIECLSGIPGNVGAAPIQNIGAYGQEVADVIREVELLDLQNLRWERWDREHCQFGYRDSFFKRNPGRYFVYAVRFALRPGGAPTLRYGSLANDWKGKEPPTLQDVRARVLTLRRQKSMVLSPEDPNSRSAGSFFVNPIVSEKEAEDALEQLQKKQGQDLQMPRYPVAEEGKVKLSAAWLIDQSGLYKGYGDGRIGLSEKHTLALVHRGGGTAAELVDFARFVRGHVQEQCSIRLHPEPNFLGFDTPPLG
jgi:UDP-N-acetylmuramate dehydrogenase